MLPIEEYAVNFLLATGLSMSLALLVAFRAGRMRGLNPENIDEKLGDLVYDSLKAEIRGELQNCFNQYHNVPAGTNYEFPGRLSLNAVTTYLHGDLDAVDHLKALYQDLLNHGIQSECFLRALEFVTNGGGGMF
ncbi:hypothetical protein GUJ93_ZPchr0222g11347 [Zizania palustris]|uniref:Uncharacterized protein n=1 Tax=Zizania palustris TaxID=103762 RepID=A0A8J5RDZ2_ZIZPA|nr:hypothetical protein GUJ93_ZPchr0222g11347 [Zizania palustris]